MATESGSIHVILVDDQAMVGEAMRRMLSDDKELRLTHVQDSTTAHAIIREAQPTVVIVDLVMPELDGMHLIRKIRMDESTRDIPAIMLSSESDVHRKVEAFQAGANDFLVKMPDRLELVARIQALAAKSIAERELRLMADQLQQQAVALDEANRSLQAINISLESDVSEQRERLRSIAMLGNELALIRDINILIERLLHEACHILGADAGAAYLVDGDHLRLMHAQNESMDDQERLEQFRKSAVHIPIDTTSLVGWVAKSGELVNVDDVYDIDPDQPFTFNTAFDDSTGYHTKSVLGAPLVGTAGQVIGVLQLINPMQANGERRLSFTDDDMNAVRHFASMASVSMQNAQLTRSMILRMIRMAELRDPSETGAHANRVAEYSLVIYEGWANRQDLSKEEIAAERDRLRIAAMLHDVGKVAIPDSILKKPGKLSDEEFAIMQGHTMVDAALFDELLSGYDEAAATVVRGHHERWDGTGYPGLQELDRDEQGYLIYPDTPIHEGRSGSDIPLFARIVAIADVFDALGSARSYKEAWPEARILELLKEEAGSHFDPELVEIFIDRIEAIRTIQHRWSGQATAS
ncbi:MAG: response regulator [Phycisphaerales bacterium]|nr:response regulator [Phycisphaerales bacterium]